MVLPFSIIIPTLNEEKYLPRLLSCLQKQTSSYFEIIIVDGVSEDRTVAKAESFREKFTRKHIALTIITSDKRNVSVQRNKGASLAKGTYLIFFDADVQIPPDFVETIEKETKKHRIACATTWVDADSNDPKDTAVAVLHNAIYEISHVLEIDFIPGYNCIVRKNIFDEVHGFSPRVVMEEDYDLARKISKKGHKIIVLKKPHLVLSLRRYRKEGHANVIRKYTLATAHFLFKGPITRELFDYQMGGAAFARKRLSPTEKLKFKKYLEEMKSRFSQYVRDIDKLINQ